MENQERAASQEHSTRTPVLPPPAGVIPFHPVGFSEEVLRTMPQIILSDLARINRFSIILVLFQIHPNPEFRPMPATNHLNLNLGDGLLLIGTMKGAILLRSNAERGKWEVGGPYFPGQAVYAMAYDDRKGRSRLWAATYSMHWGAVLSSSDDFGMTWTKPETYNVKLPPEADASVKQIWQIALGHPEEQDTLYCGVEPAALFKSTDAGETWVLVQ